MEPPGAELASTRELARAVIGIGGHCSVAFGFLAQSPVFVVGVIHEQLSGGVGQCHQSSGNIVPVVQNIAVESNTARPPTGRVVGETEAPPVGIGDVRHEFALVINHAHDALQAVGDAGQQAVRIVVVIDGPAVRILLCGQLSARVKLAGDGVGAAVGPRYRIAGAVVPKVFCRVVGVGHGGQVAVWVRCVAREVALGVGQDCKAVECAVKETSVAAEWVGRLG